MDLSINLAPDKPNGLTLRNPVMIASGTFGDDGYGHGITSDTPLATLGAVVTKTLTRHPRPGNPEPRRFPTSFQEAIHAGETTLLNSVGLNNPGIEAAMSNLAPLWASMDANIVISVAGDSIEQWAEITTLTRGVEGFSAIELNLSCPNVHDGAAFSHYPRLTAAAVQAARRRTDLPLWAKLSPNVPDITEIARAAEAAGADALTISNTMPALHINVDTSRPALAAGYGGLSGPALRPIAITLVHRAARAVDIPIIGVGGIMNGRHAAEYRSTGRHRQPGGPERRVPHIDRTGIVSQKPLTEPPAADCQHRPDRRNVSVASAVQA